MKKILLIVLTISFCGLTACKTGTKKGGDMDKETLVKIETTLGDIEVKLYNETPKHRDNFIKLVKDGVYEGTLFHRVIKDFMIQAGDPDSKNAPKGKMLGTGDVGYTVPAEFVYPKYFHKKGALSAARQGDNVNPKKESSGCQFYIVTGKVYNDSTLLGMESQMNENKINVIFNTLAQKHMRKSIRCGKQMMKTVFMICRKNCLRRHRKWQPNNRNFISLRNRLKPIQRWEELRIWMANILCSAK